MYTEQKNWRLNAKARLALLTRLCLRHSTGAGLLISALAPLAHAAGTSPNLPVPCGGGTCAQQGGPATWVTSGAASASVNQNTLTVTQQTPNVTLNWNSFNIGANNGVQFKQPSAEAIAINRIYQGSASQILGKLSANGQVYLINQNGIVFGNGAQVDVNTLVASTLDLTQAAIDKGIIAAIDAGQPAFTAFKEGTTILSKDITVDAGASLHSDGGRIVLLAPVVTNNGKINTPDGQTILAAGTKVYLMGAQDANLRGWLVEVDVENVSDDGLKAFLKHEVQSLIAGTATNAATGNISAPRGNVTMMGLAVNQEGRVSATTSVRKNGSVYLLARDKVSTQSSGGVNSDGIQIPPGNPPAVLHSVAIAHRGGSVVFDKGGVTEVGLDPNDTETMADANAQLKSTVRITGQNISLASGSRITAPSGNVALLAAQDPSVDANLNAVVDESKIDLAADAVIDVSGAQADLPVERNVIQVQLRSDELKDSPYQRDGVLRNQTISVDIRARGTRADGSVWKGTPLADVNAAVDNVTRGLAERNLAGGTVRMTAQGAVNVAAGATVDVSGGAIHYQQGYLDTTKLSAQGRIYDIANAPPELHYDAIVNRYETTSAKWGTKRSWTLIQPQFTAGYVEGKDAGTVMLQGPRLALDGAIRGVTVAGAHQRKPATELNPTLDGMYRPYDQVPLGAALVVGDLTRAEGETSAPNAHSPSGVTFTTPDKAPPATSGDAPPDLLLNPSLFGDEGISRLTVYSNGRIWLPRETPLLLPDGGSLRLTGASVELDSGITVHSGNVNINSRLVTGAASSSGIVLAGQAFIDATGRWVNDNPAFLDPTLAALYTAGGQVTLAAKNGNLTLVQGSRIDVSAGAWRNAQGKVQYASAGSIGIANTGTDPTKLPTTLTLDAVLRGYGRNRGGRLNISAEGIVLSDALPPDKLPGTLWLPTSFFQSGGFGDFAVNGGRLGLLVATNTIIALHQDNEVLKAGADQLRSGSALDQLFQVQNLPDYLRQATNLSLSAADRSVSTFNDQSFAQAGVLQMQQGARIEGEVGANVSLSSNTRIEIDGVIEAPAGNISVVLQGTSNPLKLDSFVSGQNLWLGKDAALLAPGAVRYTPNPQQPSLLIGEVLTGGTVELTAESGFVATQVASRIDVSGTTAPVDIPAGQGGYTRRNIGSDGGSVRITGAEGIFPEGRLAMVGGDGASGGQLTIQFVTTNRNQPTDANATQAPRSPRIIRVNNAASESVLDGLDPGQLPPNFFATHDGEAIINASALTGSGAADITLQIVNEADIKGNIVFANDVALQAQRRIVLDAPNIDVVGHSVALNAPYVALSATSSASQNPGDQIAGTGNLSVAAQLIDLVGAVNLNGAAQATLQADDVRLRGQMLPGASALAGAFTTSGALTIAGELYPATLTHYTLTVNPIIPVDGQGAPQPSVLTIAPTANSHPVLSAGGSVELVANTVEQSGVIKAPLGTIALHAVDLTTTDENGNSQVLANGQVNLHAGSVTSVNAEDQLIPFGRTEPGPTWGYDLSLDASTPGGQVTPLRFLVLDPKTGTLPQKDVRIEAASIKVESGATVDVSGGGDLFAYEWINGVGGSKDVLATQAGVRQYAIVPNLGSVFAPYDSQIFAGSSLRPGDSVVIDGAAGLPAGSYALLPARYALLPGAFLVTEIPGQRDLPAGFSATQLDGSTVVDGRYAFGAGSNAEQRSRAFAILSSSDVQRLATYNTTTASQFFASAGDDGARLPHDSGTLSIAATQNLQLAGSLAASSTGRGAEIDIVSTKLALVGTTPSAQVSSDYLAVDAVGLQALGAESIVLGGKRIVGSDGTTLQIDAQQVLVDANVTLTAPSITLAARQEVDVAPHATLTGTGKIASDVVTVKGDSAVLQVSGGAGTRLQTQEETGAAGIVNVAADALVTGEGSVLLYGSAGAAIAGKVSSPGGALTLGAPRITIGGDSTATPGTLTLRNDWLASLDAKQLTLQSHELITLVTAPTTVFDTLTLRAPGLTASEASAASASLNVRQLSWENPEPATSENPEPATAENLEPTITSTPAAAVGAHELALHADTVDIGAGDFSFAGFNRVALTANQSVSLSGTSHLHQAGDLAVTTPVVTTKTSSDVSWQVDGAMTLDGASANTTTPAAGVASRWTVDAQRIGIATQLVLPTGYVALHAHGDQASDGVELLAGVGIDVSGSHKTFDGVDVYAPGGDVILSADHGSISLAGATATQAQAKITVAGDALGGRAGSVTISAAQGAFENDGSIDAHGVAQGGSFVLDAGGVNDFAVLNEQLNSGGFSASRELRLHGVNVTVAAQQQMDAARVRIVVDGTPGDSATGNLTVAGQINASSKTGGNVELYATNDLTIASTAVIDARAGQTGAAGHIALGSSVGTVAVQPGSLFDVSGGGAADQGTVNVRAAQQASATPGVLDEVKLAQFGATVRGADHVSVEAVASVTGVTAITDTEVSAWNAATADFMTHAPAIETRLNTAANTRLQLTPGLDISSDADLALLTDWNLSAWRYGPQNDVAGRLTLRAAGNLVVGAPSVDATAPVSGGSLNDGFNSVTDTTPLAGASWSYRLSAGADLLSSDPLAVRGAYAAAPAGDVVVAKGVTSSGGGRRPGAAKANTAIRLVRTGTGSIEVAAARDIVLADTSAVIYTAGELTASTAMTTVTTADGTTTQAPLTLSGLNGRPYTDNGGDLRINAGRDIVGAPATQLVSDWLFRTGGIDGTKSYATGWAVAFDQFRDNVAALGGGTMDIRAGRDVLNLSASIPTIGRQDGGATLADSQVTVLAGGNLDVQAGRDIASGMFYTGRGNLDVVAGRALLAADRQVTTPDGRAVSLYSVFGVGDTTVTAEARQAAHVGGAHDPMAEPANPLNTLARNKVSQFFSYTPTASFTVEAWGQDVTLEADSGALIGLRPGELSGFDVLAWAPPTVSAISYSGNVEKIGGFTTFPAPKGNVVFLAAGDVRIEGPVKLSDAAVAGLPTASAPGKLALPITPAFGIDLANAAPATVPVHALSAQPDELPDSTPVRLIALQGDVVVDVPLQFAKAAHISAGRDVINPDITVQNVADSDATLVSAGRDIVFPLTRDTLGQLNAGNSELLVNGPGRLELLAGRNVDLQTARGIKTLADITASGISRPGLPSTGADIAIITGVGTAWAPSGFVGQYLLGADARYDGVLLDYMRQRTGDAQLSVVDARTRFTALSAAEQRPVVLHAFFSELQESGRGAADRADGDFSRGRAAVDSLFPGYGTANDVYDGHLNLYFSQILTKKGGDIVLVVPGGDVNAGVAAVPAGLSAGRGPEDLGIVARTTGNVWAFSRGDFLVNQSRVFAADGGDILIWSDHGDIDAGRGAKSAVTSATIESSTNADGSTVFNYVPSLTGSGIRSFVTTPGRKPGTVDLFAPAGVVNAGDAGIGAAGDITIAAVKVLGADNIDVGGKSVGVPVVDASSLSAGLAGLSGVANSATKDTENGLAKNLGANGAASATPLADEALSFLDVVVEGFGDDKEKNKE